MTSDDTDTTTESKATSLLVSFIVDGSVGVALFLLFCVLRPRVPHVFDARREARKLRLDTKSAEAPPVPPGLFAWVPHVLSFSDEAIYNLAGMDALMQVTFFRFARRLFTACTIVGLAVLMPINWFAGDKLSGISRTTMSNIPADSGALWAHLLCAYAITAYMFYELRKLHLKYREYRERTLHAQILSARTVLLQGVPATATTASIVEAFRPVLPDVATALRVWDLTDVADLLEQREEALTRLERARYNANLPQLPWSYRFQRIVMSMCGLTDNIKQPLLSSRQPAMLRGWRLFASPQQEAEYWAAVIEMVDERVISTREAALARAALPAAFVTFATSRSASIAAQCNLSSIPAGWLSKPAPEPRDVIWHNLGINPVHRRLKEFVSFAAVVGLFVLYSVLLTFAATAAEINSLSDKLLFLDVFTPDPWLRGFIEGVFSSVFVLIIMALLPIFLSWLATWEGLACRTFVQQKLLSEMYLFFIIEVFFVTIVAGAIFNAIGPIIDDPSSIVTLLSRAVPQTGAFFFSYVLLHALVGYTVDLVLLWPLIWTPIVLWLFARTPREIKAAKQPRSCNYAARLASELFVVTVGLLYSSASPVVLPAVLSFFLLGELVYRYHLMYVWEPAVESFGLLWPRVHTRLVASAIIYHLVLMAIFALKLGTANAILVLPLPVLAVYAHRYYTRFYLDPVRTYPLLDPRQDVDPPAWSLSEEFVQPELQASLVAPDDVLINADASA
eukprot:m.78989 g.78989  ORF g.78989 m.78989 type:complete len:733 (-) comp7988_c0_seq3:2209-4407(-)